MSRIAVHLGWSLLGLVLLFSGPAGAGDVPDFSDRLDVRVVTLDVLVGDRKGRAIRGLTRDDFELAVDGVATPISNFSELGATDGQEPADTPLRLVVYVDNGNLEPHQRKQVLDSLKGFLGEQLDGRNQMMLASGDRFRFDATGGFSKSPEVLLAQLQRIQETAAGGTRNTDFRDIFRDIEQAIVTTGWTHPKPSRI